MMKSAWSVFVWIVVKLWTVFVVLVFLALIVAGLTGGGGKPEGYHDACIDAQLEQPSIEC